jgi:hypothetical protein
LVTLKANLLGQSLTELNRLLLKIERSVGSVGFSNIAGNTLIWQIYVDNFDQEFWSKVSKGNGLELYTQELDRYW